MAQIKVGPISQSFYNLLKPCHDLDTRHSEQAPTETVHIQTMNEGGCGQWSWKLLEKQLSISPIIAVTNKHQQ